MGKISDDLASALASISENVKLVEFDVRLEWLENLRVSL